MLSPERAAEIRQRVVAPYLDLSDLFSASDRRDQGHYVREKDPIGEREESERARLAEISRLSAEEGARKKEQERFERQRLRCGSGVVADFLAGMIRRHIVEKYGIHHGTMNRIIREGTNAAQRERMRMWHHCKRVKRSKKKKRMKVVA